MTRTLLALTLAAALSSGASAALFTGDNGTQSATADFEFTGTSSLALTLTNTTTDIQSIVDILDDFHWLFADTSFTMSLNSVFVSGGFETCSTTQQVTTCTHDANTNGSGTWGLFTSGGQVDMYSFGNKIHPYAIVNPTFMDNAGDGGGLDNGQHNPVLLGPVTFNFTFTGLASTDLSLVDFTFGTQPLHVPGTCTEDCGETATTATTATTVPEPMTALLVGTALVGLGLGRRRRLQ